MFIRLQQVTVFRLTIIDLPVPAILVVQVLRKQNDDLCMFKRSNVQVQHKFSFKL